MLKKKNFKKLSVLPAGTAIRLVCDEAGINPVDILHSRCEILPSGLVHAEIKTEYQEVESYLSPETQEVLGLLVLPIIPSCSANYSYCNYSFLSKVINF